MPSDVVVLKLASLALQGKIPQVVDSVQSLAACVVNERFSEHGTVFLRIILYAICVHESPSSSLDFSSSNRICFTRLWNYKSGVTRYSSADRKGPFIRAFSLCVSRIPSLESYIQDKVATHERSWQMMWLGRVLLRALCGQPNNGLHALFAYEELIRNGVGVEYGITLELVSRVGERRALSTRKTQFSRQSNRRRVTKEGCTTKQDCTCSRDRGTWIRRRNSMTTSSRCAVRTRPSSPTFSWQALGRWAQ